MLYLRVSERDASDGDPKRATKDKEMSNDWNGGMAGFGYPGKDSTLGDLFGKRDSGGGDGGSWWGPVIGFIVISLLLWAMISYDKREEKRAEVRIQTCVKAGDSRSWCEYKEEYKIKDR